jgi:hypothetical protein
MSDSIVFGTTDGVYNLAANGTIVVHELAAVQTVRTG